MHVLAFRHGPPEGIGTIAGALERNGIDCVTVDSTAGHQPLATSHGGLVVMGGPMSANDDLPWISHEIDAIRDAVGRGIPVLGICLGAQLIARALGARVFPNPEKEIGWYPLQWTAAAATDPLFRGFTGVEMVFQWHGDTFDLPDGAEHLACSAGCRHQAFRFGGNVYGVQFHPEVTPEIIEDWLRQDAACGGLGEATEPIDPRAHEARLAAMAAVIFDRWCGLLK
jgi:GMP synthase-like glutamine amidotransferase